MRYSHPGTQMLLQSYIDESTCLNIEVEASGDFHKNDDEGSVFHPDKVLDNVVEVAALVARRMSDAASRAAASSDTPPSRLTLTFGIRVDAGAVVSLSSDISKAHFQVKAEWAPKV